MPRLILALPILAGLPAPPGWSNRRRDALRAMIRGVAEAHGVAAIVRDFGPNVLRVMADIRAEAAR